MYTEQNYQILKKKARNCTLLLGVILLLGLLVGFLFYYFATRENKLTFIVLGTISLGIIFSFFHLMYSMRLDYLRKANQFIQILKDKGEIKEATYISTRPLERTLLDNTTAKEITFLVDNEEKVYLLSTLFDYEFKANEVYQLTIVSGFIKEINHEQ